MENPRYAIGQEVEALVSGFQADYAPATIKKIKYQYTVTFTDTCYANAQRTEDQIRPPRPSEEEAWEKATMLIGKRNYIRGTTNSISPFNADRKSVV